MVVLSNTASMGGPGRPNWDRSMSMWPRWVWKSASPVTLMGVPCLPGALGRSTTTSKRAVRALAVLVGDSLIRVTADVVPPPPQATPSSPNAATIAASLRMTTPLPDPAFACHPGSVSTQRPAT